MADIAQGIGVTGAGLSHSSTILGAARLQDRLTALWRAEDCPALTRNERISMIEKASRFVANGAARDDFKDKRRT